jgi:hypothetical protein
MSTSGVGMLILVVVFLVGTRLVPQGRKFLDNYRAAQLRREEAHDRAAGGRSSRTGLECPACGDTEFEPRPSRTARAGTAGTGHLAGIPGARDIPTVATTERVACMKCGVHYDRG